MSKPERDRKKQQPRPQPRPQPQQQQQQQPEPQTDFEETDDTRDFAGYDTALQDWIAKEDLSNRSYTASLYRYDPVNRQKQWLLGQWTNEILTAHDVGLQFGSGEYRYMVSFPPKSGSNPICKAFKFNIHPVYDEYRKKSGMAGTGESQSLLTVAKGAGGLQDTLAVISSVVEIIKPLIARPQQDMNQGMIMMQNYKMMQDVLKQNLLENVNLHKTIAENAANREPEDFEPEGENDMEQPGILQQIIPLIEKFLPMLTGGNTPQSAATISAVKALPEFQELLKDKDELKKLISGLDAQYGAEVVNKILSKMKIKRQG